MMTASEDSLFWGSQEVNGNQRTQVSATEILLVFFVFLHNKVKFKLTKLFQNQCLGKDIAYVFTSTTYI